VRAIATVLAVLVALGASCAPTPSGPATIARPTASGAPIEPIDASSRTGCATRVLSLLVDAINARDEMAIGRLIGPGPAMTQAFQWVSMSTSSEAGPTLRSPGINEVDYSPEGARRILLQHAARGERWSLGIVRAGAGPSWHGGVDAEVHFERTLADGRIVKTGGKTALSCLSSAIYVLSLGDE
jgi:hypothetical protein